MTLFANVFFVIGAISLVLGLATGFVMHRSDFCMAGMFRDLFLFRRTIMLKSLFLLVVTSMVLFEGARRIGLLSVPFPLLYPPSAANLLGGLLFGIGMVLAGGCVVGTLYKMGSGSILSLTSFAGLIFGSGLYAEIHPVWAAFARQTTMFPGKVTIAQITGLDPLIPILIVALPGAFLLFFWHSRGKLSRQAFAAGYLQPYKAALALSLIGLLSYVLVGMPLGVTSSFTKIAGFIERIFFEVHFNDLAFFKLVPLNSVHRLSGSVLRGGAGPTIDALAAIQFPLVFGIVAGSAISAALLRELHISYRVPLRQYVLAAVGGIAMGLASRMTPTCNVWHIMGGLPILAASSILFLIGILPGAWLGGVILVKILTKGDSSPSSTLKEKS